MPYQLFIDVAYACNLRCKMCDLFSDDSTASFAMRNDGVPQLMDFEVFKQIVDKSHDIITTYNTQLRGEPFIHPRFCDMLAYIREKAPDAKICFNTNGMLLTPELIDRCLEIGVDNFFFSIDAADPEVYDIIRIRSDLARVEKNIKYLLDARENPSLKHRPEVNVSFVLQEDNEHEKHQFLQHWLGRADSICFYTKMEFDGSRLDRFFEPAGPRKPCESLYHSIAVLSDGAVVPCCGDSTPHEVLGYIQDASLREIAAGGRYQEMRRLHEAGQAGEISLCKDCDTWIAYETKQLEQKIRPEGALFRRPCTITQSPVSETWTLKGK